MTTKIVIEDKLHPEDNAMLQALYSRSPASVDQHLTKVAAVGSGAFVQKYMVGYGHKSIGDCGSTTIFIENVSMLAAKAIQDWPLYSGQESSTRYIDFSKQAIMDPLLDDPLHTDRSGAIIRRWMDFYFNARAPLRDYLRVRYPRRADEDEAVYERAINARTFDVLRAFLPAGATTNLSWHTNLRQAADKLSWLIYHPEPLIRQTARDIADALLRRYPHSFRERPDEPNAIEEYRAQVARRYSYFDDGWSQHPLSVFVSFRLDDRELRSHEQILQDRPRGAELPRFLTDAGDVMSEFLLDFGSFRDIQRHRNGVIRMPLLTTSHGFHPWYLEELPSKMQIEAGMLIAQQADAISKLEVDPVVKQHYVAMGFRVYVKVTQGLPAFLYRIELRTQKTVHPTLRRVAQREAARFAERYPKIAIHANMDPDDWDVRRGQQTIEERR